MFYELKGLLGLLKLPKKILDFLVKKIWGEIFEKKIFHQKIQNFILATLIVLGVLSTHKTCIKHKDSLINTACGVTGLYMSPVKNWQFPPLPPTPTTTTFVESCKIFIHISAVVIRLEFAFYFNQLSVKLWKSQTFFC